MGLQVAIKASYETLSKGFEVANEKKKSVPQMVKGRYQVRLNIGKSLSKL